MATQLGGPHQGLLGLQEFQVPQQGEPLDPATGSPGTMAKTACQQGSSSTHSKCPFPNLNSSCSNLHSSNNLCILYRRMLRHPLCSSSSRHQHTRSSHPSRSSSRSSSSNRSRSSSPCRNSRVGIWRLLLLRSLLRRLKLNNSSSSKVVTCRLLCSSRTRQVCRLLRQGEVT